MCILDFPTVIVYIHRPKTIGGNILPGEPGMVYNLDTKSLRPSYRNISTNIVCDIACMVHICKPYLSYDICDIPVVMLTMGPRPDRIVN